MAIPQNPLSPVPWEQDGFLRVKVEAEEASLSQVQKCSPVNTAHTEAARLRFRGFCYKEAASPYEALAQLRELCCQWLQPEVHTKEQMLEQLVLEQFLGVLPPEIQAWVGAQHPESGKEAAVLVAELSQSLDRRGWEPGSELSEASYKQSDLEESDGATETLLGGVSPGCAFGDACEPQGSSERREGPSGEVWTMSVTRVLDSRKTSGPHKNAADQLGCESGALGDSPNVWPHFTSQEKTPSKENSSALASFRMEPPCAPSGRASTTCGDCGNTVLSAWALEVHRKSHPRKTPYTCNQCGKAFRRSTHLAQHQVVHTGAKPHACKDCGKAFSRVTHLTQHQRVHTGEKPYKCEDCGKAFRRSTHLTQHRRTHTGERPYTCDACGKAFSQSTHLTQHRRVHTGEKPYKCGYCGRAFSDCSTLIRHLRTHSGEKPYHCHVCPKAFAQSSSLTEHQRVHTG